MKTVVIWDMCGQEPIQYFVSDGDITRFDQLYINTYTEKTKEGKRLEQLLNELTNLMYAKDGSLLQTLSTTFPYDEVKAGAQVIVCGFLP